MERHFEQCNVTRQCTKQTHLECTRQLKILRDLKAACNLGLINMISNHLIFSGVQNGVHFSVYLSRKVSVSVHYSSNLSDFFVGQGFTVYLGP